MEVFPITSSAGATSGRPSWFHVRSLPICGRTAHFCDFSSKNLGAFWGVTTASGSNTPVVGVLPAADDDDDAADADADGNALDDTASRYHLHGRKGKCLLFLDRHFSFTPQGGLRLHI